MDLESKGQELVKNAITYNVQYARDDVRWSIENVNKSTDRLSGLLITVTTVLIGLYPLFVVNLLPETNCQKILVLVIFIALLLSLIMGIVNGLIIKRFWETNFYVYEKRLSNWADARNKMTNKKADLYQLNKNAVRESENLEKGLKRKSNGVFFYLQLISVTLGIMLLGVYGFIIIYSIPFN